MKIVSYAVVTGWRDAPRKSPYPMVLFTDQPEVHRGMAGVEVKDLHLGSPLMLPGGTEREKRVDGVRVARWYSTHPHILFPDADITIYMNGSIRLAVSPHEIAQMLNGHDMAAFRHDRRDCLYEEGYAVAEAGIDNPEVIRAQLSRYRELGHPDHWGLWGLSFYVRRNSERMDAFNEGWWQEIRNGSFRDQISFPMVVRTHGIKVVDLPGTQDANRLNTLARHPLAPRLWPGVDIRPAPNDAEILTVIPFARDKNLGRAYNDVMERLPDGGWACLLDHDVSFTTTAWWAQLQDSIARYPEGSFTAMTNQIHSPAQRAIEVRDKGGADLAYHRRIGEGRAQIRTITDITHAPVGWGGMLMLISKASWRAAGGFRDGMFCVDHQMHYALRDAGRKVYVINGLYLYHGRVSSSNPMLTREESLHATDPNGNPCACRVSRRAR